MAGIRAATAPRIHKSNLVIQTWSRERCTLSMRLWPVFLLLAGCAAPNTDSVYKDARNLLDQGNLKEAKSKIDVGIARESSWRFRLLQAEYFNLSGDADGALKTLDVPPPAGEEDLTRIAFLRGQAAFYLSHYEQAKQSLDEAAKGAKLLASPTLAEIELWRGNVELREQHPKEAEQFFLSTLKIATEQGNARMHVAATASLGLLLMSTQRCDKAVTWFDQALVAYQQMGAGPKVGKTLGNLGWCYFRLGDTTKAADYLRRAEASAKAAGNLSDQQIWLGDLASVSFDTGDVHGAADAFRKALAIAREAKDPYWMRHWSYSLANAQIALGDVDGAELSNREAAAIEKSLDAEQNQSTRDLFIPVNEARIEVLRGNLKHAESLYRTMLSRPSGDPIPVLNAHSDFAQLLAKKGNVSEADREYRQTLAEISNLQADLTADEFRLSYLSALIDFCDNYVEFLVQRKETDRALEVTESIRARVLNERAAQSGSLPAVSVEALKQAAGSSGSMFLAYWLAPNKSYLWIIRPRSVELKELTAGRQRIAALVTHYRALLENLRDPMTSEDPAGRELSEILLGPVRDDLRNGAKIVVAPDRDLHSINLESLPDPNDSSKYVVETTTLSVSPSFSMLAAREHASKPVLKSLLMIGDAESASRDYPRLPNAAREIALISQSFAASELSIRSGPDAVPASYLESSPSRFSAIHFAAHANASRENPLESALILSPGPSGYTLTAREVMSVPLQASLVTLSACRSAGAKTYSGEGLVGLSWAFLRAGAGSVVAGLWDVTDQSTAKLMGDFYAQMTAGAMPADALRTAKLKLVHSEGAYKKPFYWAPFQLYAGRL